MSLRPNSGEPGRGSGIRPGALSPRPTPSPAGTIIDAGSQMGRPRDPTGTAGIRARFRADMDKRWQKVRRLVLSALGAPGTPLGIDPSVVSVHASLASGSRPRAFQAWLDEALRQVVYGYTGTWMEPYLTAAMGMARVRAEGLVKLTADAGPPDEPRDKEGKWTGGGGGFSREQLEKLPVERLDKMAFGVNSGDVITVSPEQLNIKYPDDLENPQDKFDKRGMAWARSVDLSEPVKVSVDTDGKWWLEDGHHRWFAAQKTNRKLKAEVEVKGNSIKAILQRGVMKDAIPTSDRERALLDLTASELDGICAAVSQQATRVLTHGLLANEKPQRLARKVADVVYRVGRTRSRMLANALVVKAHASASLDAFRKAGIQRIGLIPERRQLTAVRGPHGKHLVKDQDEESDVDVLTAGDSDVCFPAQTMVRTDRGNQPIESIRSGDLVLTRLGFRPVTRSIVRKYLGKLALVVSDHASFVCTANHPVWVKSRGFTQARNLKAGDILQLIGNEFSNVCGIFDLSLGEVNNAPSKVFQDAIAFLTSATMPPGSVDLYANAKRQGEVDAVAVFADFLLERYFEIIQSKADDGFEPCFASESSIAGKRTKFRINRWLASKIFVAVRTSKPVWWSSAFFRAIGVCRPFATLPFLVESLFASLARYSSGLIAVARSFRTTFGGAVPMLTTAAFSQEGLSAAFAVDPSLVNKFAIDLAASSRTDETDFIGRSVKQPAANGAINAIGSHILVYNLTVQGVPEFYANGILVHNCQECEDISNDGPYDIEDAEGLIPAHPNCRCAFVPTDDLRFASVHEDASTHQE